MNFLRNITSSDHCSSFNKKSVQSNYVNNIPCDIQNVSPIPNTVNPGDFSPSNFHLENQIPSHVSYLSKNQPSFDHQSKEIRCSEANKEHSNLDHAGFFDPFSGQVNQLFGNQNQIIHTENSNQYVNQVDLFSCGDDNQVISHFANGKEPIIEDPVGHPFLNNTTQFMGDVDPNFVGNHNFNCQPIPYGYRNYAFQLNTMNMDNVLSAKVGDSNLLDFPTGNYQANPNAKTSNNNNQFASAITSTASHGHVPEHVYENMVPKESTSKDRIAKSIEDIASQDPMGMAYFLAGKIRRSFNTKVYKCSKCCKELSSSQAYGGHMKSHAFKKKKEMGQVEEVIKKKEKSKRKKENVQIG